MAVPLVHGTVPCKHIQHVPVQLEYQQQLPAHLSDSKAVEIRKTLVLPSLLPFASPTE